VLQLRQALEDMLLKSGVKDEASELDAPTQVSQQISLFMQS